MNEITIKNEEIGSSLSKLLNELIQKPEQILTQQTSHDKNSKENKTLVTTTIPSKEILLSTSQKLFQNILQSIDTLNNETNDSNNNENETITKETLLSSSDKLYHNNNSNKNAELIWEQIDVLNQDVLALFTRNIKDMKKCMKKMKKGIADESATIQLLDYDEEKDDEDDDDDDNIETNHAIVTKDDDESDDNSDGSDDESSDEDDDSDAKRMKERMERAMNDDSDDDSQLEQEEESDEEDNIRPKEDEYDSDLDAAAHELNYDGFFNIKDMEDFADEEEDYHNTDQDDKNKRFRSKEDVDALFGMYDKQKDDDDDDYNEQYDNDGEMDATQMTAADFFGDPKEKYYNKKKEKKLRWDIDDDDNKPNNDDDEGWPTRKDEKEEEKETALVTTTSNTKLDEQTNIIESSMLAEKPWQLTGEVKSSSRPTNSLLDIMDNNNTQDSNEQNNNKLQFDMAQKLAPIITEEYTQTLESIIKQRILNEEWDDVIPRALPSILSTNDKDDAPMVSQEKSKLSLGDLYERDYLKKQGIATEEEHAKQTMDEKIKDGLRISFGKLCSQLDALSNYHFAPRPIDMHDNDGDNDDVDLKHVTTAPALTIEEIIPLSVSNARQVTPEEVYERNSGKGGILKGETELTTDEKKRLRNANKASRRARRKEKLSNDKLLSKLSTTSNALGVSNAYEKQKIAEELSMAKAYNKIIDGKVNSTDGDYTKSTTFFQRLEDEKNTASSKKRGHDNGDGDDDVKRNKKSTKVKL